jgi:hypothetical protein
MSDFEREKDAVERLVQWIGIPVKEYSAFSQHVEFPLKSGAGEGIRTLDPNLGKVVLYP